MSVSPERRAEIRAAVEKVLHPGPWFAVPINEGPDFPTKDLSCIPHPHWDLCCGDRENPSNVACILTDYDEKGVKGQEDIEFIAGAREWVPDLLGTVNELQEEFDQHALIVADIDDLNTQTLNAMADRLIAKDAEITRLQAQLKEWEQYTGFLYAHGFFHEHPAPSPPVTLTSTEDPPRG